LNHGALPQACKQSRRAEDDYSAAVSARLRYVCTNMHISVFVCHFANLHQVCTICLNNENICKIGLQIENYIIYVRYFNLILYSSLFLDACVHVSCLMYTRYLFCEDFCPVFGKFGSRSAVGSGSQRLAGVVRSSDNGQRIDEVELINCLIHFSHPAFRMTDNQHFIEFISPCLLDFQIIFRLICVVKWFSASM
jgi:hypothetical protein